MIGVAITAASIIITRAPTPAATANTDRQFTATAACAMSKALTVKAASGARDIFANITKFPPNGYIRGQGTGVEGEDVYIGVVGHPICFLFDVIDTRHSLFFKVVQKLLIAILR